MRVPRLLRAIAAVVFCGGLLPQMAMGQASGSSAPQLAAPPLELLRQFEASASQEYTIGDGDEVDIQVVGRPELSGAHLVGPDGEITLPLAGSFQITDLTREAAAQGVAKVFERYYTSVDVTVRVAKYGSNRIYVLGHVAHPGVIYFDNAPTLLEALTRSPAPSAEPRKDDEPSFPLRCAIFRGKDQAVWIDVKTTMEQDSSLLRMRLQRDDVLFIPDERDNLVSVLGEVQHPGMVKLLPDATLLEVIARSGGLTTGAGSAKIEILRPGTGVRREIAFKDLLNPSKTVEASVQTGDVIYIQKGTLAKVEYALQQLSPVSSFMLFGTTFLTK